MQPTDEADETSHAKPRRRLAHGAKMAPAEKTLVGASGFTGLWALTWMTAEAMAASTAVAGGFAVGGVMASSGLALLWWKTRTMRELEPAPETAEPTPPEDDPSVG